jgi:hypothetical protein
MLASVAQDVLSIPATGAGVERLINSARDICHYPRGSLKPTTIQDLVMYMCATKFDLGEEEHETFRQFFSREERETANEEKDAKNPKKTLILSVMIKRIHRLNLGRLKSMPIWQLSLPLAGSIRILYRVLLAREKRF